MGVLTTEQLFSSNNNSQKKIVSNDELFGKKNNKGVPDKKDSMSNMGVLNYAKKHPYKFMLQDPVETVTGKSLLERSQKQHSRRLKIGNFEEPNFSYIPRATVEGTIQDAGALVVGGLTSPASLATMGIGSIPVMAKTAAGALAKSNVGKVIGETIANTKAGQAVGKFVNTDIKEIPGKIVPEGIKKVIKGMGKSIRKYKTQREGSKLEEVRIDLTPKQRVDNLVKIANDKYKPLISEEKNLLDENIANISVKESEDLKSIQTQIDNNKLKLKSDIDSLSQKMKDSVSKQEENIDIISQKSAIEGKRRTPVFSTENSTAYGSKLDDVVDIAEREGKLPTKSELKDIFDQTDSEIKEMFIDSGAPLSKYNALKEKYLISQEEKSLSKAFGGDIRSSGIDFSKATVSGKKFDPSVVSDETINLKELLKDNRSVSKTMSAKARGPLAEKSDEDLVNIVFQKNVGEYMASKYPDFDKLQKAYSPIISTMKNARKLLKPGETGTVGNIPKTLKEPDLLEQKLIKELESGYEGFSKGIGPFTRPIKKAQSKLEGTKKGYEIAKQRIERLSLEEKIKLEKLLDIRKESYALQKKAITIEGQAKQAALQKNLEQRLYDLEKGDFRGGIKIDKLAKRKGITDKERKTLEGGGIFTETSYYIRRLFNRSVMR